MLVMIGEPKLWDKGLLALGDVLCRCMGAIFVSKQIKFLPLKPKAERYVPSKVSMPLLVQHCLQHGLHLYMMYVYLSGYARKWNWLMKLLVLYVVISCRHHCANLIKHQL